MVLPKPTIKSVRKNSKRNEPILKSMVVIGEQHQVHQLRRDEPDQDLEMKQSDAIRSNSLARMKAQAKAKLKAGNKVPTRAGAPLKTFEQFRADAGGGLTEELTKKQKDNMEQVYLSARALDFDKWVLFTTEML
jgi:hypothetical protein